MTILNSWRRAQLLPNLNGSEPSDRPRWAPDESFISGAAPLYLPSSGSDVFAVLGGFGRVAPESQQTGGYPIIPSGRKGAIAPYRDSLLPSSFT